MLSLRLFFILKTIIKQLLDLVFVFFVLNLLYRLQIMWLPKTFALTMDSFDNFILHKNGRSKQGLLFLYSLLNFTTVYARCMKLKGQNIGLLK